MDAPALLRVGFADLHSAIRGDLAGIDAPDLFDQPAPGVNHIGFLLWHLVRDEDYVIAHTLGTGAEVWTDGHWGARLGLPVADQGTGFDVAALPNFLYDLELFWEYAEAVWQQTDERLANLDPAALGERQTWSETWTLANTFTTGCLSHGWLHLGEIRQLRGLHGWRADE